MNNKDLNIFVIDTVIVIDGIIRIIQFLIEKTLRFIDSMIVIISNGLRGLWVDVNGPPKYKNMFCLRSIIPLSTYVQISPIPKENIICYQ